MTGLRVIGGELGGRPLVAPHGHKTRPTSGRVREALFSILGDLEGAHVLDLYAGSGALAIEALSRGAARAVLVERDRAALGSIGDNLSRLGVAGRAKVLPVRVSAAHALLAGEPFDLVLCDPPWTEVEQAARELARLAGAGLVAPGGRVALEHAARGAAPSVAGLETFDRRAWGDTAVSLYRA